MERKWVVVAFGDIMGFGSWSRRALITAEIRNPFIQRFYREIGNFVEQESGYVKYLGDGFMVLKELPEKRNSYDEVRDYLSDVRILTRKMKEIISECGWPSPDGFRTRIVAGHVDKLMVPDPVSRPRQVPEYVGYAINLAQRLLEIRPKIPLILHESVFNALGSRRHVFKIKRIKNPTKLPRGVDAEDIAGLWSIDV